MSISHADPRTPPPDPRAWLDHIPGHRRGPVANWFHAAVRQGAHQPLSVLQAVRNTAIRRGWAGGNATDAAVVLAAIERDQAGALAYAASVIVYEQLPYEERQRAKAERAIHFIKETMRGKTVTPAQTAYLQALGYTGAPPVDRACSFRPDRRPQAREGASMSHHRPLFLGNCPRCGDRLQVYHSHSERRPTHFFGCLSYPACTYTAPYDTRIHELLTSLETRLIRIEAQYAWLLVQVEDLSERMQEVAQ